MQLVIRIVHWQLLMVILWSNSFQQIPLAFSNQWTKECVSSWNTATDNWCWRRCYCQIHLVLPATLWDYIKSLTIKDCIYLIAEAWDKTPQSTLLKAWNKVSLDRPSSNGSSSSSENNESPPTETLPIPEKLQVLLQSGRHQMQLIQGISYKLTKPLFNRWEGRMVQRKKRRRTVKSNGYRI